MKGKDFNRIIDITLDNVDPDYIDMPLLSQLWYHMQNMRKELAALVNLHADEWRKNAEQILDEMWDNSDYEYRYTGRYETYVPQPAFSNDYDE